MGLVPFPRRLLVISHTAHYKNSDGRIVGFGATVDELSHLASLFEELIHIAPLHSSPPSGEALPYAAANVRFVPVKPSGGTGIIKKMAIPVWWIQYWQVISHELHKVDAVHVRAPANIALLAMILLMLRKHPSYRWFKYAGNWLLEGKQAWSYRVQRWLLYKGYPGGWVTRNGQSPDDPPHVIPFYNPSFSQIYLDNIRPLVVRKTLQWPLRLIYVGRIERAKGIHIALDVVTKCAEQWDVVWDVVGEGKWLEWLREEVKRRHLNEVVRIHGSLPRPKVFQLYTSAHFMLLPTASEGWPKVLSEAMAHGVVPLTNAVSSIPEMLESFGIGAAVKDNRPAAYLDLIHAYLASSWRWKQERDKAIQIARKFTYESYLAAVRALFKGKLVH